MKTEMPKLTRCFKHNIHEQAGDIHWFQRFHRNLNKAKSTYKKMKKLLHWFYKELYLITNTREYEGIFTIGESSENRKYIFPIV